tara:strand:- start:205 stop:1179 length:975 start_codon:yes stop_codon:yes gene_type:complete
MNLLIIGAGQLGSRHLQSCLKYNKVINIYVVDNLQSSILLSQSRTLEVEQKANHNVQYFTDMSMIKENNFDYLIIATTAVSRFKILREALSLFTIKYAILEKVLFQDLESYTNALTLIKDHNLITFVNCPIRTYPFFKKIKNNFISNDFTTSLNYVGGDWVGLACNSIHYLDLLNFLSNEKLISIKIDDLDDGFIPSKRAGSIEFTGTYEALFNAGSSLNFSSIRNSDQNSIIEILNGKYKILINELSGEYKIFSNNTLIESSKYDIVFQSDLTHLMIDQIEKTGNCELIKFDQSLDLHKHLIVNLLAHYNDIAGINTPILPIT